MPRPPARDIHDQRLRGGTVVSLLDFAILILLIAPPANLIVIAAVVNAAVGASQELG